MTRGSACPCPSCRALLISEPGVGMILNVLALPADRPWGGAAVLVATARAAPLTYGSSGAGGAGHLAGEQLNLMAGLRNIHEPYRGGAPLITDLIGGRVDFAFTPSSGAKPQADSGRFRILAVSTKDRRTLLPAVTTVAESAQLPGLVDMADWSATMAPRGVPARVLRALHAAAMGALREPEVVAALALRGIEATPSTPGGCAAFIGIETVKWTPVVRASGARPG